MYDVIGDIHGRYDALHALLVTMDYRYSREEHAFYHPCRELIFLGDYLNRGGQDRPTVRLVKNTCASQKNIRMSEGVEDDADDAIGGNHERAAVFFHTPDPKHEGEFLRPHTPKNIKKLQSFLDATKDHPDFLQEALDWFRERPLFAERGNFSLVHACWHEVAIELLKSSDILLPNRGLNAKGWQCAADKTSHYFDPIKMLVVGPHEKLPDDVRYRYGDEMRDMARVAWWNTRPTNLGNAFTRLSPDFEFGNVLYNPRDKSIQELRTRIQKLKKNVLFGHMELPGEPAPLTDRIACLDWKGRVTAYRISDDEMRNPQPLHPEHLVSVLVDKVPSAIHLSAPQWR